LKRQASKKRKRADVRADVEEAATAETSPPNYSLDAMHSSDDEDEDEAEAPREAAPTFRLGSGRALPEFLPDEYLEDEDSEDEMAVELTQPAKKAKKIKFTELLEKKPKDYRKGSTTYRVAEAPSKKMAPKSSFNARTVKESWLQGRSGVTRKPLASGFFKTR
jgi:U3 small nucleolar RNA-associated protein 16